MTNSDDNEDELGRGFSDDELDGMTKDKRSLTALSRKTCGSKISLSNFDNMSESDDDSSIEYEDEDDRGPNESISEVLQRYGFNAKKLLGVNILKDESGEHYSSFNPPLTASLFDNVPPTINFITQDEKSK